MSRSTRTGPMARRSAPIVGLVVAALATAAASPAGATAGASSGASTAATVTRAAAPGPAPKAERKPFADGHYIVTLAEPPAAGYTGGLEGFAATKPRKGRKFDTDAPAVKRYRGHLEQRQKALLDSVRVAPTYQYSVALNGFAAPLTGAQAERLAKTPGVVSVTRDVERKLTTTETPAFLGLTGPGGVWESLGGPDYAGKGIVIGDLDSGYWPENPFFAGSKVTTRVPQPVGVPYRNKTTGRIAMLKADGTVFEGDCEQGVKFPKSTCNSKVISARMFPAGFLAAVKRDEWSKYEVKSPRDGDGHGSHTGSTAAGNRIDSLPIGGVDFGPASGMAPAAKLAVYKVCWDDRSEDTGGCYNSDITKAIEQAVKDGVDVINFSISGAVATVDDPVEMAFLHAAEAGVFVSASGGNDGPGTSTVNHPSPWVTTVAASTVHRFLGTVELGDGTRLRGAAIGRTPVGPVPLILSTEAGAAGAEEDDVRLCVPGSLDPEKVTGKIVVCVRGVIPRVDKSKAVAEAKGVGMVLVNVTAGSLDADVHSVPTVHLDVEPGKKVLAYAATASATARILVGDQTGEAPVPVSQIAEFSSRGPSLANNGDVLKPDLTAPGVSILAAVAPGPYGGAMFAPVSGTSMAAPHVSGLAALLLSAHPTWSPMAVKSALMTSATDLLTNKATKNNDPFDEGAGLVQPRQALDPGLIYDSTPEQWRQYLAGIGSPAGKDATPIRTSDLNQASIAVDDLVGSETVTRTVTATRPGTWTATAKVSGFDVTITPSTLTFAAAGESKSFTVTLARRTAGFDTWKGGFLTWKGKGSRVRTPIVARPVIVAAPPEAHAENAAAGQVSFSVTPASSTTVDVAVRGLVKGDVATGEVARGSLSDSSAIAKFPVTIPKGTSLARLDLRTTNAQDDLDMYVYTADGKPVLSVATSSSSEQYDWWSPEPGDYEIRVNGFEVASGETAPFTLRTFAVPGADSGNLTITPSPIAGTAGVPVTVTGTWTGLESDAPYLGWLRYGGSRRATVISIG